MNDDNRSSKHESVSNETTPAGHSLSRRKVLRTVGGTAAVGVGVSGFSGSAMADSCDGNSVEANLVFCGCTQVCWCIEECTIAEVITEEGSIFFSDGDTDPALEPAVGYDFEGCFEIGDELELYKKEEPLGETLEYDGEKILAVTVHETDGSGNFTGATTTYCNPHTCADRSIEELGIDCDVTDEGQMARNVPGGCGEPPCEHPARDGGNGQGPPGKTPPRGSR